MPTIIIGRTSKRINSTSQTYTAAKSISCTLREPCSMQTPVFRFIIDSGSLDAGFYNYAQWGSWYYWIDDIIYLDNNILEFHCHVDPLATFRVDIRNTSAFVVYGPSGSWNQDVDDTRFQPEISPSLKTNTVEMSMFKNKSSQGVVTGIDCSSVGSILMTFTQTCSLDWMSGTQATTPNGIHTAIMSPSVFMECMGDLKDFDILSGLSTAGALEVIQAFQNMIQSTAGGSLLDNIQRVIWVPLKFTDLVSATGATQRTGLMLGGVLSANTTWYEVSTNLVLQFQNYIDLDVENKILPSINSQPLRFLLNDRFTSIQIVTPGGYNDIGSNCVRYSTSILYLTTALSVASGEWSMKLSKYDDRHDCLASFAGSIGVNLKGSISAVPNASMQIAKAGAGIVTGALGMGIGSILGGLAAGEGMVINSAKQQAQFQHYESETKAISSGIQHMTPQTDFRPDFPSGNFGGGSSGLFVDPTPGIMAIHYACFPPKDISNYINYCNKYGYPVNKYMQLNSTNVVSGSFIQCSGASVEPVSGSCLSEANKSTINSYLNSGIYIE